jgi:hypothetical protein
MLLDQTDTIRLLMTIITDAPYVTIKLALPSRREFGKAAASNHSSLKEALFS